MFKQCLVFIAALVFCLSASCATIEGYKLYEKKYSEVKDISEPKIKLYNKVQYNSMTSPVNNFSGEVKDFYRLALLRSILNDCDTNVLLNQKWQEFIVNYSKYIIDKNTMTDEQVVELISNAEINVQEKYKKQIPIAVCEQAYRKSESLTQQWNTKTNYVNK